MQFSPLSVAQHRVVVGVPLPFNVRNSDGTLILARGQCVDNEEQRQALFTRGALIDIAELKKATRPDIQAAAPEELPGLWSDCMNTVGQTLLSSSQERFTEALDDASAPVLSLIERDADLAIFQVLKQEGNDNAQYGLRHSVHAAITSFLVAQRLGWTADDTQKVFKAALTMNLAMLELQGELATQLTPVTAEQRQAIHDHPQRGVEMLELAGITDRDWLEAVAQHHETPNGKGYPKGLREIGDLAALVQRADIYTAKLSARAGRDAVAADKAGRMMFMQDPGHPMTVALVKEFGIYPPGCYVKLVSGETGLVVKRGSSVATPIVAAITNEEGKARSEPLRRDTAIARHAIVALLPAKTVRAHVPPQKLMLLATT